MTDGSSNELRTISEYVAACTTSLSDTRCHAAHNSDEVMNGASTGAIAREATLSASHCQASVLIIMS